MLEQLFGSKTRVKLLRIFFRSPEQSFFVRELSREMQTQINAVRRELELFLTLGIIVEKEEVKKKADKTHLGSSLRKYYQLNSESMVFPEINALLLKDMLVEQQEFIKKLEHDIGDIVLLILTGSFTGDKEVSTDILIVGDIKPRALSKLVEIYEKEAGFQIRYTVMSEQEFVDRRYVMDKFIYGIFEAKHLRIVNLLDI